MFGDVVKPSISVGSKQWYTLPLSILAHVAVIAVLIVIPLLAADVLPTPPSMMAFVSAPPPPQAAAPKPVMDVNPSAAPVQAPTDIKPETGRVFAEQVATVQGDIGGVVGGIPGGVPEAPPPPPPPPAPVRVGGAIQPPKKVRDQAPTYPPIAQSARVQGVVILEATIGPDGKVQDVRVLRSIPLLDAAAIEAVRQWQYTPTLLNNVPVPVIMTVTVNFTLR